MGSNTRIITDREQAVADALQSMGLFKGSAHDIYEARKVEIGGRFLGISVLVEFYRDADAQSFAEQHGARHAGRLNTGRYAVEIGPELDSTEAA